jgi:hypothetical protein
MAAIMIGTLIWMHVPCLAFPDLASVQVSIFFDPPFHEKRVLYGIRNASHEQVRVWSGVHVAVPIRKIWI